MLICRAGAESCRSGSKECDGHQEAGFQHQARARGIAADQYGSATVPIYQTSTFAFDSAQNGADRFAGRADGFIYTRIGNPTIHALEQNVAELENGADGVATEFGHGRGVHRSTWRCSSQGAHLVEHRRRSTARRAA